MTSARSVILIEFNELSPLLMTRFMSERRLPNFSRFHGEAEVFLTEAEEHPPYLEPWIQWITVHSGLTFQEHKVFNLGDGSRLSDGCVWDVASEAGHRVWVCGSMNIRYDLPINGYVLPDPWAQNVRPYPEGELSPYVRFVQQNVQEHTNDRRRLSVSDYVGFLRFMVDHGLSPETSAAIVRQLWAECWRDDGWKRALILDRLQFDLFRHVYARIRPHLSTFFLNSTAHLQHMYWRNMEPELFTVRPSLEDQAAHDQSICRGYEHMDRLLGEFVALAGDEATLVFCTALSQQPCLTYEDQGGRSFYRPREFESLLTFLGARATVAPVMSHQFHLGFADESEAEAAEQLLRRFRVDGEPAMYVTRQGAAVFAGCSVKTQIPQEARLCIEGTARAIPFYEIFYKVEGTKSGMHHRDGMLWIRTPARTHAVHEGKVPLARVAPTVLALLDVRRPGYMKAEPLTLECPATGDTERGAGVAVAAW